MYGKTRAEVVSNLKEAQSQIDQDLTIHGSKYTVGEYLKEWLSAANDKIRPTTYATYEAALRLHIYPHIGNIRLKDLRPDQIQTLYNLKANQVGPSSIRIMHAILHKSLNQAVNWGLIGRNPVDAVTRPKERKQEMQVLTPEQAQMILSYVVGTRDEALYHLALTTGLRRGELTGLTWDDLDWTTGDLQVQRQVIRVKKEGLVFMPPKTKAGQRSIILGETAIEKLRAHFQL
jgi:integrase